MTDRDAVTRWVEAYERAWRTAGTGALDALFTTDATYLHSPYARPVVGLAAIKDMWEKDRDGPDEVFTMTSEVLAVDGATAVLRAEVRYGEPVRQEYRDLWVLQFAGDGRCSWFEEWPYWPGLPYTPAESSG